MTLQEYMAKAEISDAELARKAGISRPYLTRIRQGVRQPSLGVAAKLADVTKLPMKTFLREEA
jgi:transcriptional regulator with XRE-family HTH domain